MICHAMVLLITNGIASSTIERGTEISIEYADKKPDLLPGYNRLKVKGMKEVWHKVRKANRKTNHEA